MEQIEQTTTAAPAYSGYRAPAVSIRATYTVGDVTDELVVDIDQGPVDVAVIRGVIDALTETRGEAELEVTTGDGVPIGVLDHGGARVYGLPRSPSTTTTNSAADKEAQA